MGRTCGTYGGEERRGAYTVLVETLREGDHLEGQEVDGRIILKWIFEKWKGYQYRDRWRAH
jgi:hypothetical protein